MIDCDRIRSLGRRKKISFFRVYILFPIIVCSQILFVVQLTSKINDPSLRDQELVEDTPPHRLLDRKVEARIRSSSLFQRAPKPDNSQSDVRPHKLFDRLQREREENEGRDKIETSSRQQKQVQGQEEEESKPRAENANQKVDWRSALHKFEEFEKWDSDDQWDLPLEDKEDEERKNYSRDFSDRLIKLRDELVSAAASAEGSETRTTNERIFFDRQSEARTNKNDTTRATPMSVSEHSLAKPPLDQSIEFLTPFLSLPKLTVVNTTTIILVPSHPGSFLKRQAIRETWKAGTNQNSSTTIVFVIAQSGCVGFVSDLVVDSGDSKSVNSSISCDQVDHTFLKLEQNRNQDLVEIPMKEEYNRLSEKMMQAYNWAMKTIPNLKWIAKADDDMFVNVQNLEQYVKKYSSETPMVIGEIHYHTIVGKGGKWADKDYNNTYYPFWPKGSAGYVLSRATVEYLTKNSESLHRYQGEDTNIGIWLDEARKTGRLNDVTYIHAPRSFTSRGTAVCKVGVRIIMVGHDLTPGDQMYCQKAANNAEPFENIWRDAPRNFQHRKKE